MDGLSKSFGKLTMSLLVLVAISFSALPAYGQYCSASGGGQQYISGVVVGNLVNTGTGSDGYVDYTRMSTTIAVGESQIATIVNGLSIAGSQCGIWVDWNADSDFDDAGETVVMSGGPAAFTGTVTPPGGTTSGDKRMRVRIMGTGSLTACGNTTYGEVEDYTIAVVPPVSPWTGSGDANDPYQVWTAADMQAIGADPNYWDAHFKLMANIDLSAYTGTSFNIIGLSSFPFTGVFDGNGHTISNFTYDASTLSYPNNVGNGVFRYIGGSTAEVKDLGLINPDVDAGTGYLAGSLVGEIEEGSITNCYVEGGSVSADGDFVGGLVGVVRNDGTISNCYSSASVSGGRMVGGLVGQNRGTISNCYSTGSVSGNSHVGGLVGTNKYGCSPDGCTVGTILACYASGDVAGVTEVGGLVGGNGFKVHSCCGGTVSDSYATGNVSGSENVGGLVGYNREPGTVSNCYSRGSVIGTTNVGGLVGYNNAPISDSFWDKRISGRSNMCGYQNPNYGSGCDNANGKTTAQMQDVSTFLAGGWDFVGEYENGPSELWVEPNGGGYMILWWQLDPLPPLPTFSGGTGEPNDPYLISTSTDLNCIGHNLRLMEKSFRLINNIDLAGVNLYIIGSQGNPYSGVFDGSGHTISNFTVDCNGTDYIGLFSFVDGQNAEIKDLGLIDPNVDAGTGDYVGSLVGYIGNGTISGCYVEGGSLAGQYGVGGLVGYNNRGTITHCYSTGSVSGSGGWTDGFDSGVGGLVGNNDGTISNCHSAGSVAGTVGYIGGLVGFSSGEIYNSYATGSVSGGNWVGGLVGGGGTIIDCYSTCDVSGSDGVGGLIGQGGSATSCYATGSVSATGDYVGGLVGKGGSATNCYATGSVSGTGYVGGLVGESGTISNCYSSGSVSGENIVGGLVGRNPRNGTISNCYVAGSVEGVEDVGGLAGFNYGYVADCYVMGGVTGVLDVGGLVGKNGYYSDSWSTYWGTVTNCYARGPITGILYVGGVLGNNDGEVAGSFWDVDTTGPSNMCGKQGSTGSGCDNGNGKTTGEMQMGSTFTVVGWDFVYVWDICEGTNYPKLAWQVPVLGDFVCPDGVDWSDLAVLCEQWLGVGGYSADIAPAPAGDGIVNLPDFAALADNWLTGL